MDIKKADKLCEDFPEWVAEGPLKVEYIASAMGALQTIKWFVNRLYAKGYMIISPEELKKINGMTIIAEIHGQNPFKPKEK